MRGLSRQKQRMSDVKFEAAMPPLPQADARSLARTLAPPVRGNTVLASR